MGPAGQFCMHHDDNSKSAATASRATSRARSLRVRTAGDSLILCLPSFETSRGVGEQRVVETGVVVCVLLRFRTVARGALVTKARARGGRSTRVFPYSRHQFEHQWIRARTASNRSSGETETFRWRFHDLRHLFCSWALSKDRLDLAVADVSRLAGHHSPEFTYRTYVKPRPGLHERVRQAGRRVTRNESSS